MEVDEVKYPAVGEAVDRVADRAADDQAERQRREAVACAGEPDGERDHGGDLEREQKELSERAGRLKQAVADARIARVDEVEERPEVHRRMRRKIVTEQEIELARLIGQAGEHGDDEA